MAQFCLESDKMAISPTHMSIYGDCYLKQMKIDIDPETDYFWIGRFIQQVRTWTMAQVVLEELQQAVQSEKAWDCNYNDIYACYDPVTQLIIAQHELTDISTPPPSAIHVQEFIRIFSTWISCLE